MLYQSRLEPDPNLLDCLSKVEKIESCIGKEGTIELPVLHEHSAPDAVPQEQVIQQRKTAPRQSNLNLVTLQEVPSFKPKILADFQATDSELSDHELVTKGGGASRYYGQRKQTYNKFKPIHQEADCSPATLASASADDSSVTRVESKLTGIHGSWLGRSRKECLKNPQAKDYISLEFGN